ncbi:AarF/ABC1/UbiB kinase family protein [Cyanobium sp. Morenito 9A2]|uniref:ABC1 kinase family protein n=1 Tax=Cyanobium sp. Morenito 9A2 TaxID=2823718 RepID=UPI0020CD04CE|nr:AarF/ABC1/UbiB kinase family protein [Cyanobium sp. Morenito 9A2]MCP9850319.1 AarF/ABC1/UbiB kinase family protein [Cyanobium sp. Morenito 9A2]
MVGSSGDFIEAAGLLSYDPATIRRIYSGHPQRLLRRLWQTLVPIGLYLLGVGFDRATGRLSRPARARGRAKECAELLVQLGPAFIKAGQALSTRPDIVPPMLLEELAQLQDQLPGFDSTLAMACIEEDLGQPVEAIYDQLDREPISAASLGQVHKGVLKGGAAVAVKVQRPGLREQITLDLYIVRNIAAWLNRYVGLIRSDLVALIDELGQRVFEEMDYLNEASNAERFAALHRSNRRIAVPLIHRAATSRRVLTMEWIDGVKLTNLAAVKALGIDPDDMVQVGVNCSLQQLLEHGFFHADPHPGNLLALADGRLAYLDFGMMSTVSRSSRTGLIQAVVHLVNRNFSALSHDFVQLGFLAETVDLEPIVPAFETVFGQAIEQGVSRLDFKAVTDELSGVMYRFPFQVPPYYALIIRSLVTLEGIALSVDPSFKILGAAYPYFARRLMEDPDPELRESLRDMLFDGDLFRWQRLDNLITSASLQDQLDLEGLLDQVLDFLFSPGGGMLREQLVEAAVEQMDEFGWQTVQRLGQRLPRQLQPPGLRGLEPVTAKDLELLSLEPVARLVTILRELPGFDPQLLLSRLPRLLREPDLRRMGLDLARRLAERGVVRLLRDVLVTPETRRGVGVS